MNGKRLAILIAGWTFVVLGVLGLFLPILQGVLFLLIGLYLLSRELAVARWYRQYLRRRYPKLAVQMDKARDRAATVWRRIRGGR
ncbi:MAG TPA: PGPGW domain-containing protein [Rhodospirillales bacterium]|jgi:uncharacterized membrane protein YbaN (DUF454 family)